MTGSEDKTSRLWDLDTGQMVWTGMPVNKDGNLPFAPNGQLEHIGDAPDVLLCFVRGMEVWSVTEILSDQSEAWRKPPVALQTVEVPRTRTPPSSPVAPTAAAEVKASRNPAGSMLPSSPEPEPSDRERQNLGEARTLSLFESRPTIIPNFIRKLFR